MSKKYIILMGICMSSVVLHSQEKLLKKNGLVQRITGTEDIKHFFNKTAHDIEQCATGFIADTQKLVDEIIAIPVNERTFANTAQALDYVESLSDLAVLINICWVLELTHPDESVRTAAHETLLRINAFFIEHVQHNRSLYNAIKEYIEGNATTEQLSREQQYYLQETMRNFKRAGLDLPDEQLARVKQLKKELTELELNFDRAIASDKGSVIVDYAALQGLEQDFIDSLKRTDDGTFILGVDYPTYNNVIEHCAVEDTRKQLWLAFNNRAYPGNETILKEVIKLRDTLAQLIGFKSYMHYDIDNQMAQSPDRVKDFLHNLMTRSAIKEQQELVQWCAQLPPSVIRTKDGKIKPWDLRYMQTSYKKQHFNLDERIIAEYFPMENTVKGLLDIYRQFLGIEFREEKADGFWHPDVQLISVHTADRSKVLGYLLLDLFPRPNKFTHAVHTHIVPAVNLAQGYVQGLSIVIANFPKSTATKPALLMRDDVRVFFHEFGHALHALLGATHMGSFAGTNVKRDFVELPSQMLEEWLYDKGILQKITYHYKTGKPLSDDVIDTIIALKNFGSGLLVQTQAYYAMLSLHYFMEGAQKDPYALMKQLHETYRNHIVFEPGSHWYASFGHLMWYGAKYYGYLWSKVFAIDLFYEIKKYGLLNYIIGKKYVQEVISKGGSEDPNVLLRNFLGREPNDQAFMKDLGI